MGFEGIRRAGIGLGVERGALKKADTLIVINTSKMRIVKTGLWKLVQSVLWHYPCLCSGTKASLKDEDKTVFLMQKRKRDLEIT